MSGAGDVTRVSTGGALARGVAVARRLGWTALVVAFLAVGGFFLLLAALGAIYDYDAFGPTSPGGRAGDVEGFAILGYFAAALYVVTLWFGVAAVSARDDSGARSAWRTAMRNLRRDVWWAMPAMGACIFLAALVVPAPLAIAPLAVIGTWRVNRVEVRDGAVTATLGRLLVVSLVPVGFVALVWLVGSLTDTSSPWLQLVFGTVGAWLALLTIACTAGAAAALLDEIEEAPISWAPPSARPLPPPPHSTPFVVPPPAPSWTPAPRRPFPFVRGAWIFVAGLMVLMLAVGGVAQMGDPYPLSRTAVTLDGQGLQVVNAPCPGDRLLYAELSQPGNQVVPPTLRWKVRGDAPVPARLPVGTAPDGMRETTRLSGVLDDDTPLRVRVETQQLGQSSVDFRIRDLQAGQVFGPDGTYESFRDFVSAMDDNVPCDDPTGDLAQRRFMSLILWFELGPLVVLVVLVIVDVVGTRRRRATMR